MLTQRNGSFYLVDREEVRRRRRRIALWVVVGVGVLVAGITWLLERDGGDADLERRVIANDVASERDGVAASQAIIDEQQARALAQAEAEAARNQPSIYHVRSGDTLGSIARTHGCDLSAVRAANRVRGDLIREGQRIVLPGSCERASTSKPVARDDGGRSASSAPTARRGASWRKGGVDTSTLPSLMAKHGFDAPEQFKAFVIEITFDKTRQVIVRERAFDWKGTSSDLRGWNAASTVKLFAAIGALDHIDALGFHSSARVEFAGKTPYAAEIRELVRLAIVDSDNIAYNRLVQLAGFDRLHTKVLSERFGLQHTALMRPYASSDWQALGESDSLRDAPDIVLVDGGRKETLEGGRGSAETGCGSAACTSLQDLGEAMRRLMLQEQLADGQHFNLQKADLIMLRQAMRADRARGNNVVDAFAESFTAEGVRFYSKPGFSKNWFSDNVYIFDPTRVDKAWIVSMAGYPGRKSLDGAARILGRILADGELDAAAHSP